MAAMVKKVIINGKLLSQKITGFQRYARETLNRLDSLVENLDIELAIAEDAKDIPNLKNIKKKYYQGKHLFFGNRLSYQFI